MKITCYIFALFLAITACDKKNSNPDATGSFEAIESIVSAEASGVLEEFRLEEGQDLKLEQYIGYIDTTQLYFKKKQLKSQISSILAQKPNIPIQLASFESQLRTLEKEKERFTALVKGDAATQKQLDDINAQVELIKKQIASQRSSLQITKESIEQQADPLAIQIEEINYQLVRSKIINPIKGTVLEKYTEPKEVAFAGKPLYKIADLSLLILKVYVSGKQLSKIKLNQNVKVFIDDKDGAMREYKGEIKWISDKSEFTPKTIQTKEERANLVYAVKINVKNDGFLKIGMYGEIKF